VTVTHGVAGVNGVAGANGADGADGVAGADGSLEHRLKVEYEFAQRKALRDAAAQHDAHSTVLDVGRRTRTIPPALRRALETRDRGCRFPGCGSRFTEAHHVRHWAEGGATSLSNTVLTCRFHHRLLHEGGWRVVWWGEGRAVFVDPRGGEHFEGGWRPPAPDRTSTPGPAAEPERTAEPDPAAEPNPAAAPHPNPASAPANDRNPGLDPVAALLADHRRLGIQPDARTAGARWKRERDVPDGVWARALEALE
jgi:hypothetical protein